MKISNCSILICIIFTVFLPEFCVSIASFIIAAQNSHTTCDDQSVILLSTWLNINGFVGICFVVCTLVLGVFAVSSEEPMIMCPLVIIIILFSLFNIAWNIVGAVALFRDSMACQTVAHPLWAMTLASLILQWISIFCECGSVKITNKEK